MQLLNGEYVSKLSELPPAALLIGAALGPMFWSLGWRVHRVLLVAGGAVAAALYGLAHGQELGMPPVVASAIAGLLAAIVIVLFLRLSVFVLSGGAAALAVPLLSDWLPDWPYWQWVSLVAFFAVGALSLLCYRIVVMALTSFVGAYVVILCGLAYAAQHFAKGEAAKFAEQHTWWAGPTLLGLTLLGLLIQYAAERRRIRVVVVQAQQAQR